MEEKKKYGLTLIELLVAIAVIALILAIVIPVPDRGHPSARKVLCRSYLHRLFSYSYEYHEKEGCRLSQEKWCDLLELYIKEEDKNIFQCPSDKIGPCSYAMNENIPADANELPRDLVLLFESAPGWNQVGGADDVVTDRHGDKNPGANIAFADGSVEFVDAEEIPNLRWTVEE